MHVRYDTCFAFVLKEDILGWSLVAAFGPSRTEDLVVAESRFGATTTAVLTYHTPPPYSYEH